MKGNAHNLMKISAKRRRTKAQIQEEKKREEDRQAEIDRKLQLFDEMQPQFQQAQQSQERLNIYEGQMQQLYELGFLRQIEDGRFQAVNNFDEQQTVLQARAAEQQRAQQLQL